MQTCFREDVKKILLKEMKERHLLWQQNTTQYEHKKTLELSKIKKRHILTLIYLHYYFPCSDISSLIVSPDSIVWLIFCKWASIFHPWREALPYRRPPRFTRPTLAISGQPMT